MMKKVFRRKSFLSAIVTPAFVLVASSLHAASSQARVTIHVPSKSLAIMPYYFGKDKGFLAPEQIEPQLVPMSPPTAIAALVAGELDFFSTTGKDGTKPRKLMEREIEIYRETLKIAKTFTPDDLEDMSLLKKVQEGAAVTPR